MAVSMSFTAFADVWGLDESGRWKRKSAGAWKQDAAGWWWQNEDGSYPAGVWEWIDGDEDGTAECYYFNAAGYMLANTTTPDGYTVNADGAWVENGEVQSRWVEFFELLDQALQELQEDIDKKYEE